MVLTPRYVAQRRLDLRAAHAGIAVLVEQALFGDERRARAVHVDGAAFVDQRGGVAIATFDLEHLARDELVLIPGRVEAAVDRRPRR